MQVSSLTVVTRWSSVRAGEHISRQRTARPFVHSLPALTLHAPALLQPLLSPATLRACRQGDISRFVCVYPSLLDQLFPCDAPPLHSSQLLIQSSLPVSVAPSADCSPLRHRLPEAPGSANINSRRVAPLRWRHSFEQTPRHCALRLHSCARHARA